MKIRVSLLLWLGVFSFGMAQETMKIESLDSVFIDSKMPRARNQSGKVIHTITSEEIQNNIAKTAAQLIDEVSGIEINGTSSNDGQNLGYFVRGGRNRQVLIILDGVQQNDPSSIANDFDLRLLSASQIESIEIMKGASSVLYGSGAATAVISITTKEASKNPIAATFTSVLGSNRAANDKHYDLESFQNRVGVHGTLNKFYYRLDFSHVNSEGLSAIAAPEGENNFEEDVFSKYNLRTTFGYRISEKVEVNRFFAFDTYSSQFDDFSYTDANNTTLNEQFRTGGSLEWRYGNGRLLISDSHSWIDRSITSSFPTQFDAGSHGIDVNGSYHFNDRVSILLGANANFSRFNSFSIPFGSSEFVQDVSEDEARFSWVDPYLNINYATKFGFQLNAGARVNIHSEYGSHLVYNVNPSYVFEFETNQLKLLSSYSTAYITPSLFQLFDPLYGNEDLQPEENSTLEGGMEFTSDRNLRLSALYFRRDEMNFVDFVTVDPVNFIFQYQNIAEEFTASGVELEVSKKWGTSLKTSANYTFTQVDERFSLRIPAHKVNTTIGYTFSKSTYLGLGYQYTSDREDVFFNPITFETEMVTLDGFGVLDFNASHQLSQQVKVFASLTNLLDEEFEEVYRFQTKGRNFSVGFELSF